MIFIKDKTTIKMEQYAKQIKQGEIGGLLLGKIKKGDIFVKDAILLEQQQNTMNFELTDNGMAEFTKTASPDELASVIGWWHSHGNYLPFWSIDDGSCFERICNLTNMCVGVVLSLNGKKTAMKWRIRIKTKNGKDIDMDELKIITEATGKQLMKNYLKTLGSLVNEIATKVKKDYRIWETCPYCNGRGKVEQISFNNQDDFYTDKVEDTEYLG